MYRSLYVTQNCTFYRYSGPCAHIPNIWTLLNQWKPRAQVAEFRSWPCRTLLNRIPIWTTKWENVSSDICTQWRLKSAVSLCSLISHLCLYEETLHAWLSKMCPDKIQNRLRECSLIWPWGYKTFFMLNSAEHEISSANKIWKCQQ